MTIDQEKGLLDFLYADEPEAESKAKNKSSKKTTSNRKKESRKPVVTEEATLATQEAKVDPKLESEETNTNSEAEVYQQILALQAFIKEQNVKYYQESAPEISDLEYDRKKAQLAKLEQEYADLIQTNAGEFVTKAVGSDLSDNLVATTKMSLAELEENNLIVQRYLGIDPEQVDSIYEQYKKQIVEHDRLMLSLANVYEAKEFSEFYDSVVKSLQEQDLYKSKKDLEFCAEPKFDGIAVSLVYNNGKLEVAVTRGDGSKGYEITQLVKRIANIPQQITSLEEIYAQQDHTSVLEVRGELILLRQDFEELNEAYEAEGKKKLVNLRNGAGSFVSRAPYARKLVRHKATGKVDLYIIDNLPKQVPLRLFAYSINQYVIDGEDILSQKTSHYDLLQELKGYGFPVSDLVTKVSTLKDCENFYQRIGRMRAELGFDIDGTVFKVNNLEQQNAIGWNAESPRWAKAYKFTPEESVSQLQNVILSVSRTGSITPVAKIDKVEISGVQVSSINLYNYFQLKRLDLHQQDKVVVYRGGEVIPVLKEARTDDRAANAAAVEVLPICPGCGSVLYERSVLMEKLVAREEVTSLLTTEAGVNEDNLAAVADDNKEKTEVASETKSANLVVASAGPQGNLFCSNHKHCCNGQLASQIEFFYSKNGYEAKGLGKEIVAKFVNLGLFKHWSEVPLLARPQFIEFADKKVRFMLAAQLSYKQAYNLQLQQLAFYQLQLQTKLAQEFAGISSLAQIQQQVLAQINLDHQLKETKLDDLAPENLEEEEVSRNHQLLIELARQIGQGYRNWAKSYLVSKGIDVQTNAKSLELLSNWLFQQQAQQDFVAQAKQIKGIFLNYSLTEQAHKLQHLFAEEPQDLTWQEILQQLPLAKTDLQASLAAFATFNKFASELNIDCELNLAKVYELYKHRAESFKIAEELWLSQWHNLNGFFNASLVEQLKTNLVAELSQHLLAEEACENSANYITILAQLQQSNKLTEFKQLLNADSAELVSKAFSFTVRNIILNQVDLLRKVDNVNQAKSLITQSKVLTVDFEAEQAWTLIAKEGEVLNLASWFTPLSLNTDLSNRNYYFFDYINKELILNLLSLIIAELKADLEQGKLSYYKLESQALEQEISVAEIFTSATNTAKTSAPQAEDLIDFTDYSPTDRNVLTLNHGYQLVKSQLELTSVNLDKQSLLAYNQELASKAERLLEQGKDFALSRNFFSALVLNQFLTPRLNSKEAELLNANLNEITAAELRVETLNQKVISLKELKTIGKEQTTLAEHLDSLFNLNEDNATNLSSVANLETDNPEVSYDLIAPNFALDSARQQQLDSWFESDLNADNPNYQAQLLAQGGTLDLSYQEYSEAEQTSADQVPTAKEPFFRALAKPVVSQPTATNLAKLSATEFMNLSLTKVSQAVKVLEVYRQNTCLVADSTSQLNSLAHKLLLQKLIANQAKANPKNKLAPDLSLEQFVSDTSPVLELETYAKFNQELYFRSSLAQLNTLVTKQQQEHKMVAAIFNYALDKFRAEVNVGAWKFDNFFDRISTTKLQQVLRELEQQVSYGKFEDFISAGDKNLIKLNLTSRSRLVAVIVDYLNNLQYCSQQDALEQALGKFSLSLSQERLLTYFGLLAADRLTRWYELNLEFKPFLSKFKKKASKNDSLENLGFNWQALTELNPELTRDQQRQAVTAGIFTTYNSEKLAKEEQDLEATYNFEKTSLFKEKNLVTLASFFAENKVIPLDLLYNALGIEGVGATRVNAFLAEPIYPSVESLINFDRSRIDRLIALRAAGKAEREQAENKELLKLIYGLGDIILESFANYFSDERVQQGLKSLVAQGYHFVNPLNKPNKYHNKFNQANVVVTGTLAGIKRDQIADFVKESGGVFKSSVTKDTNYLIIAGTFDPNAKLSTKLKKAVDSGVEIIDEPSFKEIYNSSRQQTGEELLP